MSERMGCDEIVDAMYGLDEVVEVEKEKRRKKRMGEGKSIDPVIRNCQE